MGLKGTHFADLGEEENGFIEGKRSWWLEEIDPWIQIW